MAGRKKQSTEAAVREIRRRTRRKFAPEEKIRIVLEGLRGEQSISELCRREGVATNLYYRWSKDFLEAGKKQLAGDTVRDALLTAQSLDTHPIRRCIHVRNQYSRCGSGAGTLAAFCCMASACSR